MLTAFLAAVLLLAGADAAHAEPITLSILVTVGITGLSAAAVTAIALVGSIALSFGLSYVSSKLLDPKVEEPVGGAELDLRIDATVPEALILGRAITAGSLVYAETYGRRGDIDNSDLCQVIAIADHPCQGLVKTYVESQEVTWTAQTGGVPEEKFGVNAEGRGQVVDGYGGFLAFKFFDGSQTAADAFALAAKATDPGRPYTASMIGRNRTYARIHSIYSTQEENSRPVTGPLQWRFVVDGMRLYDPRKDTTVGGSGAHRFGTLSTHEFTTNLIVFAYNILRGIRVANAAGTPIHFYGIENTPAANLPLDNWFAAMNEADVVIDGEPQFHGGMEIGVNLEPLDVVKQILRACDGRLSETGGIYKVYVGAPGLPVVTFDDGVLRANEGDSFRPITSLMQRVNYVTGTYMEPADDWIEKVAPPRGNSTYEAEDRRRLEADLNLPLVQSAKHIQRLQLQMLSRSRRQRQHQIPLPPECYGIEPGDVLEWSSTRNGYIDKLFEVDSVDEYPNFSTVVSITEIDPSDYDWVPADFISQPSTSLVVALPAPKVIVGFGAVAFTWEGDAGTKYPAIRITWDDPLDGDVAKVRWQLRTVASPDDVTSNDTDDIAAEQLVIAGGLQASTAYEVQARFESFNGYVAEWSLWIPVTTLAEHIVPTSQGVVEGGVDIAALAAEIQAQIDLGVAANLELQPIKPIVIALRDSVSSVEAVRVQALQTGLVDVGTYQQIIQLGDVVARLAEQAERTESMVQEFGAENHGGRWVLRGVQNVANGLNEVSIIANLNTASLELKASHIEVEQAVASVAAGLVPAVAWNWNSSVEGWTVTNGTLTAGAGYIDFAATGADAHMDSPVISVDGDVYKIVRLNAVRTAGSGWGVTLSWPPYAVTQNFTIPDSPGTTNQLAIDLSSVAEWAGTITGIRIGVANGTTIRFSHGQVAKNAFASDLLAGLQGQITEVSVELDALEGSIELKADQVTVDDLGVTLGQAVLDISAHDSAISARALNADLTDALSRLTTAELRVDALNNAISLTIEQIQSDDLLDVLGQAALNNALNEERTQAEHQAQIARAHFHLATKITEQGEVIAEQITLLNAQVQDSKAVAYLEERVRATADFAEATARSLLEARHDTEISQANASITSEALTRASADAAEASLRQSVQSSLESETASRIAAVNSEAVTRATADSVEAAARQTVAANLATEVFDRAAAVTTEATARADADSAEAALRATVAANLATETTNRIAAVNTEATTRADADSAEAALRSQVAANLATETSNRIAAVDNEATTRADADSAEATARQQVATNLATETTNRIAAVSTEATARADADSAEATARQQVAANLATEISDRTAAITSEATTRATADTAEAVAREQVMAVAASKNVTFAQPSQPTANAVGDRWIDTDDGNKEYRWDGSTWVPISDTRIADNTAAIITETTARADADTALTSQQTTLTSTVNGNTASINTLFSTTATINGKLSAHFQLTTNVNGYVTGVYSNNDGTTNNFIIQSDNFYVVAAGVAGSAPILLWAVQSIDGTARAVLNGDFYAQRLVANTVNASNIIAGDVIITGHLTVGAASAFATQAFTAKVTSAAIPQPEVSIVSKSLTITSGSARVSLQSFLGLSGNTSHGGSDQTTTVRLYIDGVLANVGTAVWGWPVAVNTANASINQPVNLVYTTTGLSNGSHSFEFRFLDSGGSTTIAAGIMEISELRKPATT